MFKAKTLVIAASILVIIGLIGSLLTFRSSYPLEEIVEEKEIEATFSHIEIKTNHSRVTILPTDEDKGSIHVFGNVKNKSVYNFSADVKEEKLIVKLDMKYRKILQYFPKRLALEVYVPKKMYDSLQVNTDNGRIVMDNFSAKDINLETDNGSIQMESVKTNSIVATSKNGRIEGHNIETDTMEAFTDNGNIEGNNIFANFVDVKTHNGRIHFIDVTGDMIGEVNNGKIILEVDDLNRTVNLSTDNGRIEIKTKEKPTNAMIISQINNGRVEIFGESSSHIVFGEGKNQIQLSTDNGSIKVYQ